MEALKVCLEDPPAGTKDKALKVLVLNWGVGKVSWSFFDRRGTSTLCWTCLLGSELQTWRRQ